MKKLLILASLLTGIFLAGCKKYLDVNENPNISQNASLDVLLTSSQLYIAQALGNNFQINAGIWGEYWTQNPNSSQYRVLEQYEPVSSFYNAPWSLFYTGALPDLRIIEQKATEQRDDKYRAVSLALQAYSFQLITDAWGDIPFSEALQGSSESNPNFSPRYDPQQEVYRGIVRLLDSAQAALASGRGSGPGSDDLIYGGNMQRWERFVNTLKLRVYMRLSEADPGFASTGIQSLSGASFLEGNSDNAAIQFFSSGGNQNPLYSSMVELGYTQNLVASTTAVDPMNTDNDPRVSVVYQNRPDCGLGNAISGVPQGRYNIAPNACGYSYPSTVVGGYALDAASATAPVVFLSSWESKFLQAEAAERGWLPSGDPKSLFEQGIGESFRFLGLSQVEADAYIANSIWGNWDVPDTIGNIEKIVTQKWFSMNGLQNFESWTERRRTGYPAFFVLSYFGGDEFPVRFLYPNTEETRNANFPGRKEVTVPVWWDVTP